MESFILYFYCTYNRKLFKNHSTIYIANPELKKKNVDILYGPSKIFPAMWQKKKYIEILP